MICQPFNFSSLNLSRFLAEENSKKSKCTFPRNLKKSPTLMSKSEVLSGLDCANCSLQDSHVFEKCPKKRNIQEAEIYLSATTII